MARCRIDKSIDRVQMSGFAFPLGVYPIEPMEPRAGFTVTFEPADGQSDAPRPASSGEDESDGGLAEGPGGEDEPGAAAEWEEWPDRYVFDILVPATRVEALCRSLFALLPGRVYPILDVLGQDEFREVDPYVAYDLVGLERFLDGLRRFSGFFYEDGLVGFGVMSEEPFIYIFVDEHKIVTVRVETALREKVEAVLDAFDLSEVDEILGADAATHEHRGVLDAPSDRPDLLNAEEVVEFLRDEWRLVLNVDPESNFDDEGNALGITGWRCLVRHDWDIPATDPPKGAEPAGRTGAGPGEGAVGSGSTPGGSRAGRKRAGSAGPEIGRYAEVFLTAGCFREAEDLALAELKSMIPASLRKIWEQDEDAPDVPILVAADRLTADHFTEEVRHARSVRTSAAASSGGTASGGGASGAGAATPNFEESRVWFASWLPMDPESEPGPQ